MIEYIRGELTEITPAVAVVEAAGVGYAWGAIANGKKKHKEGVAEARHKSAPFFETLYFARSLAWNLGFFSDL